MNSSRGQVLRAGGFAALLGVFGAAVALRSSGSGPTAIDMRRSLELGRAVALEGFPDEISAGLELAWRERGLAVTDHPDAARVRFVAADQAPISLREGVAIHTAEDPGAPGRAATWVVAAGGARPADLDFALRWLAAQRPPTRPGTRFLPSPALGPDGGGGERHKALVQSAVQLAAELGADVDEPILRGPLAPSLSVPRDAPGEYAPYRRELDLVAFDGEAELDALRSFARWLLLGQYGAPRDVWFADGIVEDLVRSLPGREPDPVVSASLDVTFEEAIGAQPRTLEARRPALRALARLAAPTSEEIASVWREGLDEEARTRLRRAWEAMRADDAGSGGSSVRGPLERRPLPEVAALRLVASGAGGAYATAAAAAAVDRLVELNFEALVLVVEVPIAPPLDGSAGRRGLGLEPWGRRVTSDGDGAVLAAAWYARARGLEVLIEPRFVTTPGGPVVTQQDHPSPQAIESLGRRLALAVEGIAHLAERAGAVGLILFDSTMLPRGEVPEGIVQARRALRRQALAFARPFTGTIVALGRSGQQIARARRIDELGAAGETGDAIAFGVRVEEPAANEPRPAQVYTNRLRELASIEGAPLVLTQFSFRTGGAGDAIANAEAARTAIQALRAEGAELGLTVLSHWPLDRDPLERTRLDASSLPESTLSGFATARR